MSEQVTIEFDSGTLRVSGVSPGCGELPGATWDEARGCWRAPACARSRIVQWLRVRGEPLEDRVELQAAGSGGAWREPELRDYQYAALEAWEDAGRRGVVVLPTGAGKTRVALAALARVATSSLILCPTRALLDQWRGALSQFYDGAIGVVGDGEFRPERVTVTTFESAFRHMDGFGDRYGMIVVDEAHHHGSGSRAEGLEMCAASCRIGLTATPPEEGSAAAARIEHLIGPVICELRVADLSGQWLAPFMRLPHSVELTHGERESYDDGYDPFAKARKVWIRHHPDGTWKEFMGDLLRMPGGRRMLEAYRRAVDIATFPTAKRKLTAALLARHRRDRTLVFTANAGDAYTISADNLVPVITAETPRAERAAILSSFASGKLRALVSARVLNEGIDVPDANVAIVVAGAHGTREHIQRIGRVLRPADGKKAIIHELVTAETIDDIRSRRRSRIVARALDSAGDV